MNAASSRGAYVCRSCLARLRTGTATPPAGVHAAEARRVRRAPDVQTRAYSAAATADRPLRVAIVGSGPAGFYAATRIIERDTAATVDMFEKLPVPFGLVRYGVAPDHPEVKDRFEELATSPRFQFFGNVTVGNSEKHHLRLETLRDCYDALLLTYGAETDQELGVPGERLRGIISARDFVAWYNELPERRLNDIGNHLDVDTAHVIGNGNVALDVARIFLTDPRALETTDISQRALTRLKTSGIRHVKVWGRRGPMQAAFTIKELRELLTLPDVRFDPIDGALLPETAWIARLPRLEQRKYRFAQLLAKGNPQALTADKSWSLNSLAAPVGFEPDPASEGDNPRVGTMILQRNAFVNDADRFSPAAKVRPVDGAEGLVRVPAGLVIRSIGYKPVSLPGSQALGLRFDTKRNIIVHDSYGRALRAEHGSGQSALSPINAAVLPGVYCAGWLKTGPTGVIASTMEDAFATADAMLADHAANAPFLNGRLADCAVPGHKGLPLAGPAVSWRGWKAIDDVERSDGRGQGRVRSKLATKAAMLAAAFGNE